MEIVPIDTPSLGDRSYVVHDGEVAFVVDPQRDIDRVLAVLRDRGARLTDVFETHVHNDYVTGGLALARATGATYHVNAADPVSFERSPVKAGDLVEAGEAMRVRAVATPGHTFTHLAYLVESAGEPPAVFTGGSLLYGSVGRPDLLGSEHTRELAHAQYASANRLAAELPEETWVFPTHGFGSFCASAPSAASSSTIWRERQLNPVLTRSEQSYVDEPFDAYPAYYDHLAQLNLAGPGAPDLSFPRRAGTTELRRRIVAGEWVVDLRHRAAFAAGHVTGTLNFGIDGEFATYLGWLLPWGTPVTLLGETREQVARAQRELARIGIDRPAAAATGRPGTWTAGPISSFPTARFADLARAWQDRPVAIVDVRRNQEWRAEHVAGAVHIPLHELPGRLGEVPGGEAWVHCNSGYRSSIGASLLAAAGRRVVTVDDLFERAAPAGLDVVSRQVMA
ncbi:MBL fold metallo-hydrolase [Amycolatopsis taiwanensis]|uniref:MBL fold metallo-hydrolase n=1 Tax=Amycolatopsis taiwanensis TaxID=342230 RepID=UPI0004B56F03|nr:MBL fold metallo-hydrolase [Amycolatopsis taiwanensis]